MADKIADECLKNKKISLIKIRIEKLDIFKDAESVGIKIIRKQKK
jgi:dihydroneopterin aldolase